MDLGIYVVGMKVRVELINSFFYEGVIVFSDDNSLSLKDRNGNLITLRHESILYIREVKK